MMLFYICPLYSGQSLPGLSNGGGASESDGSLAGISWTVRWVAAGESWWTLP